MPRPYFLRWGGLFGTHPHATKTSESRSGSRIKYVDIWAAGFSAGAGVEGIVLALRGEPFGLLTSATIIAVTYAVWRALSRRQTAQRWREAIKRRDELRAARAEAVRLHKPVSHIDAELKPLTNRMMSGAI